VCSSRKRGLEGEDEAVDGARFDRSTVDAEDEEGETDTSEAAYDKAGILSYPPSISDAMTSAALKRALEPRMSPPVTTATVRDQMLNCVKSTHALSLSGMVALDTVLSSSLWRRIPMLRSRPLASGVRT
jgi:hypothetical protein